MMETAVKTVDLENVENKDGIRVITPTKEMDWQFFNVEMTKEEMSVSQFMNRLEVFKFNDPIQRNCVWSLEKKSLLIVSILEEISIGEIKTQVIRHNKKKFRNVLDGKQRLTTIRDFVRNRYALVNAYVRCYDKDGEQVLLNLSGMYFKDLPVQFQDRITSLILDIKNYEDLDEQMKAELFQRWNNGEALKPSQLRKAKMDYDLLLAIAELKKFEVVSAGFSNNAINNDMTSDMLLKALAVLKTDNHTSLDSRTLNKYLDEKAFTAENINELKSIVAYLNDVFQLFDEKEVKKSFGAFKTITLIYIASKALQENRSVEDFAEWVLQFFVKDYRNTGYAVTSGTAKLESVTRRNQIALDHYQTYFNK